MHEKRDFDAVVVGAGPNGLAAAITLKQAGLSVLLVEGSNTIGGGLRSATLTLPGFIHDVCSAIHPMAAISPFFNSLPLAAHGLEYIYPPVAAAHPFDDGTAAVLKHSIHETAALLGTDGDAYIKLMQPVVKYLPQLASDVLGPLLRMPRHLLRTGLFGLKALQPATMLAGRFRTEKAKGLWAGMAAHAIQPLTNATTSAIGLMLMAAAHRRGWPLPKGGAVAIANALASLFLSSGGKIETGFYVRSLDQLPSAHTVLLDVTPRQLLQIAGQRFTKHYQSRLQRYRYGPGVFKIDWALDDPIPFTAPECRQAGTVHLGATLHEIVKSEKLCWKGIHANVPYVLLAQQSLFDDTRAPAGKQVAWAYCHVPNGSVTDMTATIEKQVERFAPGFRERILARHTMNSRQLEDYNGNYIGGDINGGAMNIAQLFARPVLSRSPYRTSGKGIYICSSSTPPGSGVHGMCGHHAARRALKDIFNISIPGIKDKQQHDN